MKSCPTVQSDNVLLLLISTSAGHRTPSAPGPAGHAEQEHDPQHDGLTVSNQYRIYTSTRPQALCHQRIPQQQQQQSRQERRYRGRKGCQESIAETVGLGRSGSGKGFTPVPTVRSFSARWWRHDEVCV